MTDAHFARRSPFGVVLAILVAGTLGAAGCGDRASGGACDQVANGCPVQGDFSCAGDTIQTCEEDADGCLVWTDGATCGPGTFCAAGGCCGDGEITGGEVCDGSNLGLATCQSEGYGTGTLACLATCVGYDLAGCSGQGVCGNGVIEGAEQCDGDNLGITSCTTEGFYSGSIGCNEDCTPDTSGCSEFCGDGQLNGAEDCDGNTMGTQTCGDFGYYFGSLTCDSNCVYDTGTCFERCGDGVINGAEACDGADFGGETCFDYGYYSGSLTCDANCDIDASTCAGICGDGVQNGFEACDGTDFATATCVGFGFAAGSLTCDASCMIDTISCVVCIPGQYHCNGNELQVCDPGPPADWSTILTCDADAGYACDPVNGICRDLTPIGGTTPTGTYYQYAMFTTGNSQFLGGCDVGSDGEYLYVNRGSWYQDGSLMDVYRITLLDTDGDGLLEPNQHPDNPLALGTMEERVLTYVTTYNVPELGMVHRSEIFPVLDRAFFVSGNHYPGTVFEHIFSTGVTNIVANAVNDIDMGFLGYGATDGRWYAAHEWSRRVYSFHAPTSEWVAEFEFPNLSGNHMDGIEVVTSPSTGIQYVYVSDMTSDYLGQYRKSLMTGEWVQENLFEYAGTGNYVEGMGFGALNHFWITGDGNDLYEIGGGDLSTYIDP